MNIDNELRWVFNSFTIRKKKNPIALLIYSYLVINAVYCDKTINGIQLQTGDILTSIRRLSANTGLSEQQVKTSLKNLIDEKYITKRATRNYTIFHICRYKSPKSKPENIRESIMNYAADKKINEKIASAFAETLQNEGFDNLPEKWESILLRLNSKPEKLSENLLAITNHLKGGFQTVI